MVFRLFSVFILVLSLFVHSAPSFSAEGLPLPSLAELETMVSQGPEVLAALHALARDEHLERSVLQEMGPKLFAGVNYGYSHEPASETSEEKISYGKLTFRAGVTFPILGTWNREKIGLLQAKLRSMEGRISAERVTEVNVTALRKAYIVLWGEIGKRKLMDAFLADREKVEAALADRTQDGLLLESDRLEFSSAYDLVLRDRIASRRTQAQAVQFIREATGRSWTVGDEVMKPTLPDWDGNGFGELLSVKHLAGVRYQEAREQLYRRILGLSERLGREGSVEIGVTTGRDFPGATGAGAYVGVNVLEPFGSLRSDEDETFLAASSDLERRRAEDLLDRIRLDGELIDSQYLLEYALGSVRFGVTRARGAAEAVRQNGLRYGRISGDTLEALQRSRYDYLRAALDLMDAQLLALQALVEMGRFAPSAPEERAYPLRLFEENSDILDPSWLGDGPKTIESRAVPRPVEITPKTDAAKKPSASVYVWRAEPLLNSLTRGSELDRLIKEGFDRVLLSFNSGEVRAFKKSEGARASLRALLKASDGRGVRMDLLLGDPSWILPEHRVELANLVRFFAPFEFDGLHLDLEPDSIPGAASRRRELAGELIRTLELIDGVTDLPISLSVHPRYLEGDLRSFFGPELAKLNPEEVAVMLYSTDAELVVRRFGAILRANGDLHISLAQSIEKVLSTKESYGSLGRSAMWSRLSYYDELFDRSNFRGFVVQAWLDYKEAVR